MPETIHVNKIITEEQVRDVYQKLINYCNKQLTIFEEQTQSQIVETIKNKILNENNFKWNETSLVDYINAIIYMIKGQQFARTINSFSKRYLLEELHKDFGDEIYYNAKKSLEMHEEYYRNITNRRRLKKAIKNFKDKWDNTDGNWKNEYFEGIRTYKNLKINASYGYGNRITIPNHPYMNFLKKDFLTNNGAYPFLTYIHENNEFEVGISISRENRPNLNENIVNKIEVYESKFFPTNDLDVVVNQLDICIEDFGKILKSDIPSVISEESISYVIKNYTLEKKVDHYFKIDNKDKLYPRRFIVNEAAKYQNLDKEYNTDEAKQVLENIFGNRIEFISNNTAGEKMDIKNIILYGAPGVGKTHNYKKLISLIEERNTQKEIFGTIKDNELCNDDNEQYINVKNEKRVEFITFHQSFGYEDFIEGFRPNEEGSIKLEDGIFKQISSEAKRKSQIIENIKNIDFNDYLKVGQEFETKHGKKFIITAIDEDITFKHEKGTEFVGYRDKILEHLLDEEKMNNNIYYSSQVYISREIYKQLNIKKIQQKNFYLVIDEINRGNISKIFGELITLIEESKRDKYEVTLPYSKEKFKVPSNLYIIGTMNTTDKSIALIDVALRRRFTFIKMQPNSKLVLPSFKNTFDKLNEKIKEDLGEEYQIGHSYFMNIEEADLDFVKEYKIKPLLEEYYYGDDKLKDALNILDLED